MSYRHIENLYRNRDVLMFKQVVASEKIHGTSAHVSYNTEEDKLTFFSGGASYDEFLKFFDQDSLLEAFRNNASEHNVKNITIYGEAYGGKMQGMREIYGPQLRFIAFEVLIDAEQDSEVFLLDVDIFDRLTMKNIYVENYMYKKAADRFSDVMWAMEQILFKSFDARLAIFLYDEMVKTKSNTIKLTHEQIAKYIGSAREVVSRMLKSFEKHEVLKLSRGTIEIIDKEKLKSLI